MKAWKILALLLFLGFLYWLSLQEIFNEPHYHKRKVNFWTWLERELWEAKHGEAE